MNTYATGHRNSPDSKDSIDRTDSTDLVAIAKTLRTRGLKGELVSEILTDFPERFEGLEKVIGVGPEGDTTELTIEDHWFQKDRVILRFKRFDTIDLAEDLVGLEICVPESEVVGLEEDEFFDWQLKGCKVMAGGSEIGTVTGVMRAAGNENLEVSNGTKDYLIPFVEAICTDIDIENKVIRAEIPEGLLDL